MKKFFIILAFVLCFFSISLSAETPTAPVGLRALAVVAENVFDFGKVMEGQRVQKTFKISNNGTADLQIQRVVSPCGCTAAVAGKENITPKETGDINVTFDSRGFNGSVSKLVQVYTSDIDHPTISFTLKGIVDSQVSVEPRTIVFGEVARDEAKMQRVKVAVASDSGLKIESIKIYNKAIFVKQIEKNDFSQVVDVTIAADAPFGDLRDRLVINISGKTPQVVNIPVIASVQGSIVVEPKLLSFGIIEGQEMKRSVKIRAANSKSFEILSIQSDNAQVKASQKTIEQGKIYSVEAVVDPRVVDKDLRASLKIQTSSTEQPILLVNVYGVLPPKN